MTQILAISALICCACFAWITQDLFHAEQIGWQRWMTIVIYGLLVADSAMCTLFLVSPNLIEKFDLTLRSFFPTMTLEKILIKIGLPIYGAFIICYFFWRFYLQN